MNTYYITIKGSKGFSATHQVKHTSFTFVYLAAMAILDKYDEDCKEDEYLDITSITMV